MKSKLLASFVLLVGLLAVYGPILAHHGSASSYDMRAGKEVAMVGTVTRFAWENPHVFIIFDVNDGKGNITHWAAETHPPYVLLKDGWTKNILKPGDEVAITVFPAKSGTPVGLLSKIVLNGKVLLDDEQLRLHRND
jgi:hypothetical protein